MILYECKIMRSHRVGIAAFYSCEVILNLSFGLKRLDKAIKSPKKSSYSEKTGTDVISEIRLDLVLFVVCMQSNLIFFITGSN